MKNIYVKESQRERGNNGIPNISTQVNDLSTLNTVVVVAVAVFLYNKRE